MGDSFFQVRKKGEEGWYRPEKDICNIWPPCVAKGAAYACDPKGTLRAWLLDQDGITTENIVSKMRDTLDTLLRVLYRCRTEDISAVMAEEQKSLEWACYQACMMGAASYAFREYNISFREARFTNPQGGIAEPTTAIDNAFVLRMFDDTINRVLGS